MSQTQRFAIDAKRISLLFDYGVVQPKDVIRWADSQIIALQSVPDRLIDLSTTPPDRIADIVSHLHALSEGADFWQAFCAALAGLHEHLVSCPKDCERIANVLYCTISQHEHLPREFHFLYQYDDQFSLARENVYGDPETLRRDFISALAKFAGSDCGA